MGRSSVLLSLVVLLGPIACSRAAEPAYRLQPQSDPAVVKTQPIVWFEDTASRSRVSAYFWVVDNESSSSRSFYLWLTVFRRDGWPDILDDKPATLEVGSLRVDLRLDAT